MSMNAMSLKIEVDNKTLADALASDIQAIVDTKEQCPSSQPVISFTFIDGKHYVSFMVNFVSDDQADVKAAIESLIANSPYAGHVSGSSYKKHQCTHDETNPTPCVEESF